MPFEEPPQTEEEENKTEESFLVTGETNNVLVANEEAWQALESCLGLDPVKAWRLTEILHQYKEKGLVAYKATFMRDQSIAAPRSAEEAAYWEAEEADSERI